MHPVCEHSLMMSKHVEPMLTELCPLLVLHDWEAIAGGDNAQASICYKKVTANTSQDGDMVERAAEILDVLRRKHGVMRLMK